MYTCTSADPEIFQRGEELRKKIFKENVCGYTHQRVYTLKLDKHATLSLSFLFKRIVFNFSLCCITHVLSIIYEILKGGGGYNPRNPPLDPSMHVLCAHGLFFLACTIRTNSYAIVLLPYMLTILFSGFLDKCKVCIYFATGVTPFVFLIDKRTSLQTKYYNSYI